MPPRKSLVPLIGALFLAVPGIADAQTAGDPIKGKALFLQCAACHSTVAGQPHKVGPNIAGVYGAAAGTRPGYTYSPAMRGAQVRWDDATLLRFITRPSEVVPRTKMVFAGIADPAKRANLLAYIKTLR